MKRLRLLVPLLLSLAACAPRVTPTRWSPEPRTPTAQSSPVGSPLTIAVEYGILGLAETYAGAGVRHAKPQLVFGVWGNLEPEPGKYVWGPLDALVDEYQRAGFTVLQLLLSAESPWASLRQPRLGDAGDTFPKEEYIDDYQAFVRNVVERYNADGVSDMPGLRGPVHQYGIEREFTGFWPGTADEYVRLLRLAYPVIHSADPQAQVLLVALLMTDVFEGNPGAAEIDRRLATTPAFRKSADEIQTVLAACDAYDIVDFHSLGDYSEIPPTAAWIRSQLRSLGCGEKPIWIGDAFPMSPLVCCGGFVPARPVFPVTSETRGDAVSLLGAVADPSDPKFKDTTAWLYAEMARGLVKKIVVSAAERLQGINIGNMEDWKTGLPAVDKAAVPALGASMFMGMTDTRVTGRKPGGDLPFSGHMWAQARAAGDLRPPFHALKLVTEKFKGFSAAERLNLGAGIWAYRFQTAPGPVWVLWYDDGKLHLPGETVPVVSIELSMGSNAASVVKTPTEPGQATRVASRLDAPGGRLALTLDSTPVFVETR